MKQFKFFALMLAMIASVSLFTSCGGDDNDGGSFLVGKWKCQYDEDEYVIWTFKSDGKGMYAYWEDGEMDETETFTYTLDEKLERITFYFYDEEGDDDSETVKYSKKSNSRITVFFDDDVEEWIKQ